MPLLRPLMTAPHITDLPVSFFKGRGIRLVILDVDNTLTSHGNPIPADGVPEWIRSMKDAGISLAILSNNTRERVEPFAKKLELDFVPMACKPLSFGVTRAANRYGLKGGQIALIGDQIFTDMISGNLKGVFTILVEPYEPEDGFFFRLKRKLERPILRGLKKRRPEESGGSR